jgi:molybdate transport system substrate-binding protein
MTPMQARIALAVAVSLIATACQAVQPRPTVTPVAAPQLEEPFVNYLPGRGVELAGRGDRVSGSITPQVTQGITVGISVVTLTHDGQAAFTVQAIANHQRTVLVSASGPYHGSRPLIVQDSVAFQVQADGNWTISIEPLRSGGQPAFAGAGDSVSQFFTPPSSGQWAISGDGSRLNVQIHCLSGSLEVLDANGGYEGTVTLTSLRGSCFWEVQSDGNWSLNPLFAAVDSPPATVVAERPVSTAAPTLAPLIVPTRVATPSIATSLTPGGQGEAASESPGELGTVLVLAASPVAEPLQEVASALMVADPRVSAVRFAFAAPGRIEALLQNESTVDVLVSADEAQMERLRHANRFEEQPRVFTRSRLVLVTPKDNRQQIQQLVDLARPGVRWVATDATDPLWQSIVATLDRASVDPAYGAEFRAKAERNILSRDGSASDVLARVQQGDAGAAIVYASDVPPRARELVQQIEIPEAVNTYANYWIGVLKGSNTRGGLTFTSFLATQRAQDVLRRWGLLPGADPDEPR